jgi:hypothetical protein
VGSRAFERKPRETRPERARDDNRFADAWTFVYILEKYDAATGIAWDVDDVTVLVPRGTSPNNEGVSSNLVIVDAAGRNITVGPGREETTEDRRERAGMGVKW